MVSTAPSSWKASRRCGDVVGHEDMLGENLVHAPDGWQNVRAGIGDAEDIQQLLDGSILAALAVHGDENGIRFEFFEALDQMLVDVDAVDGVTELLQGLFHPDAGLE
jgi:hypothetical protein